jgi:hypothetical protein
MAEKEEINMERKFVRYRKVMIGDKPYAQDFETKILYDYDDYQASKKNKGIVLAPIGILEKKNGKFVINPV